MTTSILAASRRTPLLWLVFGLGVVFTLLGIRALIAPEVASAGFGLPMNTASETAFVQVYGARTIALGLIVVGLAWSSQTRALAVLSTVAATLPFFDLAIILERVAWNADLVRHVVIEAVLVVVATLLWRQARAGR